MVNKEFFEALAEIVETKVQMLQIFEFKQRGINITSQMVPSQIKLLNMIGFVVTPDSFPRATVFASVCPGGERIRVFTIMII